MRDRKDKMKQLIMDYQGTFGTAEGKRVLEDLSGRGHQNTATYVVGDTHHSAYQEGMRCVILHIRAMIAKNPNEDRQEQAKE